MAVTCAPCLMLGVMVPAVGTLYGAPCCPMHLDERTAVRRAQSHLAAVMPSPILGTAVEHSIEDPSTGRITVRVLLA